MNSIPKPRGALSENRSLADLTWLRVGGPAEYFFQPADTEDLADFLRALPADIPVFPMGVGSNLIVRDGGLRGVVIRLGRGFNQITVQDDLITAGAAALDDGRIDALAASVEENMQELHAMMSQLLYQQQNQQNLPLRH